MLLDFSIRVRNRTKKNSRNNWKVEVLIENWGIFRYEIRCDAGSADGPLWNGSFDDVLGCILSVVRILVPDQHVCGYFDALDSFAHVSRTLNFDNPQFSAYFLVMLVKRNYLS